MRERKEQVLLIFLIVLFVFETVNTKVPGKHFVLIHGSCLGAWSWYKLVPMLESSGHNVTALDLAASGINPKQVHDVPLISDYFQPLKDFMASLPSHETVILVGHSFGGLAISNAMENFSKKISVAVFVTALMPGPTLNISTLNQEESGSVSLLLVSLSMKSFRRQDSLLDSHYTYDAGANNPPTSFIFGPLYLSSNVYQLSPIEDMAMATLLMRPLCLYSEEDMSKELKLSSKKYGTVRRVFVISSEDKVTNKDFQLWMIENNPPNQVEEITGSDHMVMMSKPAELFVCLQGIAEKCS
ncbi:hypothetical protein RJ639_016433 [Escallonia herrerae]|uniref:AB hydrolase-1 domain-containing protein n=1 Tax=Escallonia herrerae TaxID=1293975 RepID=A0AA89AL48_9ASTE|nr:hypothetical protein RJ639_016433 [Escallonia herrerae]